MPDKQSKGFFEPTILHLRCGKKKVIYMFNFKSSYYIILPEYKNANNRKGKQQLKAQQCIYFLYELSPNTWVPENFAVP